jgi:hypothetical protein
MRCVIAVFKIQGRSVCTHSGANIVIQNLICNRSDASEGGVVQKALDELLSDVELLFAPDPCPAQARLDGGPQRHIKIDQFPLHETSHDRDKEVEIDSCWHLSQASSKGADDREHKLLPKRVALHKEPHGSPSWSVG